MRYRAHRKHAIEMPMRFGHFKGGLHLAAPASTLELNELAACVNMYYSPLTGQLRTRKGLKRASSAALGTNVRAMAYVRRFTAPDPDEEHLLLFVSNGDLNKMTTNGTAAKVGDLNQDDLSVMSVFYGGAGQTPEVVVADGGGYLIKWTGTGDVGSLNGTGAPANAKSVVSAYHRLIAIGDATYPNRVFMGAPGDSTADTFDSSVCGGGAYIDMPGECVALSNWHHEILVFTRDPNRVFRLDVSDPDWANWAVMKREGVVGSGAINANCATNVSNDVFFLDYEAFKSITGVLSYGDIGMDDAGRKINAGIEDPDNDPAISETSAFVGHDPKSLQIIVKPGNVIGELYCLHYTMPAWTKYVLSGGLDINCVAYAGGSFGKTFFGGNDGYIYEERTDDTATDNGKPFSSHLTTRIEKPRSSDQPSDRLNRWLLKEVNARLGVLAEGNLLAITYTDEAGNQIPIGADRSITTSDTGYRKTLRVPGPDFQFRIQGCAGTSMEWREMSARAALVGRY